MTENAPHPPSHPPSRSPARATGTIFAPSPDPLTIAALVLPQASILEVASVLDPLRSANRHLGTDAFRWRVVSPGGGPVPLTCGIELPSSGHLAAAEGADALVVIAGFRQAEVATRPLIRTLRRMAPRFRAVGGIDAGPWVLARAALLDGHQATVHWEDLEDLAAAHPMIDVLPDRYVISGSRFTAGGAAPAADLMLNLIRARHGPALAFQVAASFITTARDGAEPQISALAPNPRLDPRVAAAIARMEAGIDAPEPAARTAPRPEPVAAPPRNPVPGGPGHHPCPPRPRPPPASGAAHAHRHEASGAGGGAAHRLFRAHHVRPGVPAALRDQSGIAQEKSARLSGVSGLPASSLKNTLRGSGGAKPPARPACRALYATRTGTRFSSRRNASTMMPVMHM